VGETAPAGTPTQADEDEPGKTADEVVKRPGERIPAEELRRRLGVRPEDLTEDLDAADAETPETREKPPRC
jgi:hypothetical protein